MIVGCSITMPWKKDIIKHSIASKEVKKIGAANTIAIKKGKKISFNTDASGAIMALKQKTTLKGKKIALLGAGGLARAITYQLKKEKSDMTIYNRSLDKAKKLAKAMKCKSAPLQNINKAQFDIVINATSLGMTPKINQSPIKNKKILKNKVVFETIYSPEETKLVKQAKSQMAKIILGKDLFIFQAQEQLYLWTGKKLPIKTLRGFLRQ